MSRPRRRRPAGRSVRGMRPGALVVGPLVVGSFVPGTAPMAGAPGAAVAQLPPEPAVRSARLAVAVDDGAGVADVRVDYEVVHPVPGAVRVQLLGIGPADVDRAVLLEVVGVAGPAGGSGGGDSMELGRESGALRAGEVVLPAGIEDVARLTLAYRVDGAVEASPDGSVRLRVPVLVLDLPPEPGGGRVFSAAVTVPPEWDVAASFPTGFERTEEGVAGAWAVELAVVPSFLSMRGVASGPASPGLPLVLDAVVLLLLAAFAFVGWRHLRRVAA